MSVLLCRAFGKQLRKKYKDTHALSAAKIHGLLSIKVYADIYGGFRRGASNVKRQVWCWHSLILFVLAMCYKSAGLTGVGFGYAGSFVLVYDNRTTTKCIADALFLCDSWAFCNIVCNISDVCFNMLAYADDTVLLSPQRCSLQCYLITLLHELAKDLSYILQKNVSIVFFT